VPAAAFSLLQPNLVLARRYRDINTGHSVTLLLVQCMDARDIIGHYPPVCYPGQGWSELESIPRNWAVEDLSITGTQYRFSTSRPGRAATIVVDNFMVLPGGGFCRDMEGVHLAARDRRKRQWGVAQVQLVSDGGMSTAQRQEAFARLVGAARPLIDQIRGAEGSEL
jgi:hypothetical protein